MRNRGFTLMEVLILVTVIGLVVALLLPAINSARATARMTVCRNHRRQVATAVLNFESTNNRLPALKDRRFGPESITRKSWIAWRYTILPYLEEQGLYDTLSFRRKWRLDRTKSNTSAQRPAVVESYLCPETPGSPLMAKNLRAISLEGTVIFDEFATWQTAPNQWVFDYREGVPRLPDEPGAWAAARRKDGERQPEVEAYESAKLKWVTDGLSNTMMIFEMAGLPRIIMGDQQNETEFSYQAWIQGTGPRLLALRDERAVNQSNRASIFSYHRDGAHITMCDGSVRLLSDDVTHETVYSLATRANDAHPSKLYTRQ